eukprot:1392107-Amorphochlora_amoeboformis.AAC.1
MSPTTVTPPSHPPPPPPHYTTAYHVSLAYDVTHDCHHNELPSITATILPERKGREEEVE